MTKEELMKLVNAGFTKEEIFKLAEETPKETEETPKETEEIQETLPVNSLGVMTEGISKAIIEELQKQNILNSRMPEEVTTSSEDILANVLDLFETDKGDK